MISIDEVKDMKKRVIYHDDELTRDEMIRILDELEIYVSADYEDI